MLKARNCLAAFVITYVTIMLLSIFIEAFHIKSVADDVNMTVRMASKMSLRQAQSLDEGWSDTTSNLYMWNTADVLGDMKIKVAENTGSTSYVEKPVLNYAFTAPTASAETKYGKLFGTRDFMHWVESVGCRPTQTFINISDDVFDGKDYIQIPKVMRMGVDFLKDNAIKGSGSVYMQSSFVAQSRCFNGLGTNMSIPTPAELFFSPITKTDFYDVYDMYNIEKTNKMGSGGAGGSYYVTPANLGLTYVNEELVSLLFLNNMDLIMRANLDGELNDYNGIPTNTLTSTQDDEIATMSDTCIHNGKWAFQKGTKISNANGLLGYANDVSTEYRASDAFNRYSNVDVEYKVIDMYDSANDEILISLFGKDSQALKDSDTQIDTAKYYEEGIMQRPATREIIVALCTFKVDVYVPYMMPTMRDWAMIFNDGYGTDENFVDLKRTDTDNGTRYEYTTMFVVT